MHSIPYCLSGKKGGLVLTILFGTMLSACANYGGSSSSAGKNEDTDQDFITYHDKSVIYVFREEGGSNRSIYVRLNGRTVAETTPGSYLRLKVKPGQHEISSNDGVFSAITIKTDADRHYFILQEMVDNVDRKGPNFVLVSELEGKRGVAESNIIRTPHH